MIGRTNAQIVSGGQIITGQITGNDTTTLEITNIDTQPRFMYVSSQVVAYTSTTLQMLSLFLWFNDEDSTRWLTDGSNVYALYSYKTTNGAGASSDHNSRSAATDYAGYYDSANKKVVIKGTLAYLSTEVYVYLLGY